MTEAFLHMGELKPPPSAIGNADAGEVLRCWIVGDSLHVSFRASAFGNSAETWGMLLSDVGRHIAESFEQEGWCSLQDAKDRMKKLFDSEWASPSGVAKTADMPKD